MPAPNAARDAANCAASMRDAQLPCDLRQRPTAAHQQRHRFPLEIIRKLTTSLRHSTPFRSLRSLAKVSTNAGEPHFAFIISFDELTIALFTTGGLTATLPKQMWDDAVMKVSPALAAVSTMMLVFVSLMVLVAEWLRRRSAPSATSG
jgi:hypothetical protein